jgi:hypothetical protein
MTWMLVMIIVATGSSREHASVTIVPGYKSQDACERASKQAKDGTTHYEVTAFCVSAPE